MLACLRARPLSVLSAADAELARDLGYGATKFLLEGGTGCMVTLKASRAGEPTAAAPPVMVHACACEQAGSIQAIPLTKLLDPKTGRTHIRLVDTTAMRAAKRSRRHQMRSPIPVSVRAHATESVVRGGQEVRDPPQVERL